MISGFLAAARSWLAGFVRGLVAWTLVIGLLGAGFLVLAVERNTAPPLDREALWTWEREGSFTVADKAGAVLGIRGDFHGERRQIGDLPEHLVHAFLAIEDQRFYSHYGVDPRGLLRAFLANLYAGRTVQGGSTITQQVAKTIFLSPERSLVRKLSEFVHALRLERHLTKDEILGLYLNRIYFGAGAYGVDAAARYYFGKPATKVNLREAAMLAGLPKAPSRYAPTTNPDRAAARAGMVLINMRRFGFITAAEEAAARSNPAIAVERPGGLAVAHFVDAAIQEARTLMPKAVGDVRVETALDMRLQTLATEAVRTVMDAEAEAHEAEEAALIAFDHTGGVTALIGGRDYSRSQFNRATQAERQPGSAFKPFVYLAALEDGIQPTDPVFDEPVRVGNWVPENYGGAFRGRISVRQALAQSVNSVAVFLSETVGRDKVIEAAKRMGVKGDLPPHRSIALGTAELTLFDLTGAYLPFAMNGRKVTPHLVTRILKPDGTVLFDRGKPKPERVMAPRVAQNMNHMLFQVVHSGTGRSAGVDGHPTAGKTGTSQDFRDAWFVGYTGRRVAGVWVGNDDNAPTRDVTGASLPARIWKTFMDKAHEGETPVSLPGGYPAEPDRFTRRELKDFLIHLKRDLDRVPTGRSDEWDSDRYDWRSDRRRKLQRRERNRPRWWPFDD
ncbi:MAG: transglycosylase domain-containing protein [Alphaproteobacteria bacterium]